jgi:hypothetical protein
MQIRRLHLKLHDAYGDPHQLHSQSQNDHEIAALYFEKKHPTAQPYDRQTQKQCATHHMQQSA